MSGEDIALGVVGALFLLAAAAWVGAAIFVFVDASNRRMRNAHWWAVGTFISGPLGLVAYLLDRPESARKVCPFCKNEIETKDGVCPFCGRSDAP